MPLTYAIFAITNDTPSKTKQFTLKWTVVVVLEKVHGIVHNAVPGKYIVDNAVGTVAVPGQWAVVVVTPQVSSPVIHVTRQDVWQLNLTFPPKYRRPIG